MPDLDALLLYSFVALGVAHFVLSFVALDELEKGKKSYILNPWWPFLYGRLFPEGGSRVLTWARTIMTLMMLILAIALWMR